MASKPSKKTHLVVHELDDELLLYDPNIDRSHRLNHTATFIWQHCDGQHSLNEIAELLTEHFEVQLTQALHDTEATVTQMIEEGIISGQQADVAG